MPRNARAQGLVEAALVLPLVIFLSLGVLQFALYAHARDVLQSAAQEGARLAAEDGRRLEDGLQRIADLTRAGLGTTVEPVQTRAVVDAELVEITLDTQLTAIVPLPFANGLPVHVRASISRERFRPNGGRV